MSSFDVVLMRQDPPFDLAYISRTHLLERIHPKTLVVNDPAHVRNAPEKMFVMEFPDLMPPTMITRDLAEIKSFRAEHGDIVMKPLYGNGGAAVFRLTQRRPQFRLALRPVRGDVPRAVGGAEVSAGGESTATSASSWSTANMPARSTACRRRTICAPTWCAAARRRIPNSPPREREICKRLGPELKRRGLIFTGIDVIDGNLTEINVTSPTGIRAIKSLGGPDIAATDLGLHREEAARSVFKVASPALKPRDHFQRLTFALMRSLRRGDGFRHMRRHRDVFREFRQRQQFLIPGGTSDEPRERITAKRRQLVRVDEPAMSSTLSVSLIRYWPF